MHLYITRFLKCACMVIGLLMTACACGIIESKINSLADESARKFVSDASSVKSAQDAKECISYYKTMEMDFIKFKVKNGYDSPLERFYMGTSNALSQLDASFYVHPEYDKAELLIKQLAE